MYTSMLRLTVWKHLTSETPTFNIHKGVKLKKKTHITKHQGFGKFNGND